MSAVVRLLIDEAIRADSSVARTYLSLAPGDGDHVRVEVEGGASGSLSAAAVAHVIRRYARPLDESVAPLVAGAPRLELPGGAALALLHWRAAVDAAGRDWLVLVTPGEDPQAALAGGVAAALRYPVRRLAGEGARPR
jgi:hypothetical protein